jgi:hypothetical protein
MDRRRWRPGGDLPTTAKEISKYIADSGSAEATIVATDEVWTLTASWIWERALSNPARLPSLSTNTFTAKHAHGEFFSHGGRQLMLHLEGDEDNVGYDEESK